MGQSLQDLMSIMPTGDKAQTVETPMPQNGDFEIIDQDDTGADREAIVNMDDYKDPNVEVEDFFDLPEFKNRKNVMSKKTDSQGPSGPVVESFEEDDDYIIITLPTVNFLKVNSSYIDGSTPLRNWVTLPNGTIQQNPANAKRSFDFMFEVGYDLVSSVSGPNGHYLFLIFKLLPGKPNTVKVHRSLMPKSTRK